MSKHKIREDKVCQNCEALVDKQYCPHCGQENTESRQSFYHLFTHFVSDFLHYDSSFWRTTKNLFLAPGKLPVEYMNGKRKSYLNPFTLYIFVSFLTFFINPLLPDSDSRWQKVSILSAAEVAAAKEQQNEVAQKPETILSPISNLNVSVGTAADKEDSQSVFGQIMRGIERTGSDKSQHEKVGTFFKTNFPKLLFVYMPIFAFLLWLFHNKKNRRFFDSGIFTLHFFSLVLLTITLCNTLNSTLDKIGIGRALSGWLWFLLVVYITYYFLKGNRVFYQDSRIVTVLKSSALIIVNTLLMFALFVCYSVLVFYAVYS